MSTLRVGFFTPVHGLDPAIVQDYVCGQIIEQLYEAPFALDRDNKPQPRLFARPLERRITASRKVEYVGRLRSGLRFSDGSAVTAAEVVDSLQRVPSVAAGTRIEGRGEQIHFVLDHDDPRFDVRLSHRWASIVKREGDRILGTGPFMVREGSTPERVIVDRNPHATRPAKLESVEFRVYPPSADGSPADLKRAIAQGEVDFTTALARDDVADLEGVRKDFQPGTSTAILFLNVGHPALGRVEVRRAISEAVDRASVARISYENPHAFVARSVLPPSMWRRPDRIRFDPQSARARLHSSGVHPRRPLRMLTVWGPRPYMPQPQETARLVVEQLAAVGLEVEIVPTRDSRDYAERTRADDYDLVLAGWIADTPDPLDFISALLHSSSVPQTDHASAYANNLSRYASDAMDRALETYRSEPSEEHLSAIMDRIAEDVPVCPLFYGPNIVVHGWHVRNVELTATGMPRLAQVELD